MPQTLFNALALGHPEITIQISRIIAAQSRQREHKLSNRGMEFGKNNTNLKTVGILPVTGIVPISEFADKLKSALEAIGATTTLLNQATVSSVLGRHAFSRMGKLKLT